MKFKAVLFDLDGTLVNSLEDLADSMNCVLCDLGLPSHDLQAYKHFVGNGIPALVYRALPVDYREEPGLSRCVQRMRTEYSRHLTAKTRPYDGIGELLDAFAAAGYDMAVLSNKPDGPTRQIVSELLARWPFKAVRGALADIPKKPDPTPALWIADRLKIPPRDFLYLGDTPIDMQTAHSAGMFAVGVLWGFRPVQELIGAKARILVSTPQDLLPWLG